MIYNSVYQPTNPTGGVLGTSLIDLTSNVSITSGGALIGGGGGQVTIGGLGYTGELDATDGATTGVNLVSPTYGTLNDGAIYTSIGTAQGIAGQQWAATNGTQAAVDNNYVTGFANQAIDSEFTLNNTCWNEGYVSGGSWTWDYFTALTSKRFIERYNATAIAGQQVNMGQSNICGIPVIEGERVECSAILSQTNMSTMKLYVGWFTNTYSYISVTEVATGSQDARIGGFVTVPSGQNIAFAKVMAVFTVAANGLASAKMAQPFIRRCPATQVSLSSYNPGPLAERGANITETRVAASVSGQTGWATYSELTPTAVTKPGANSIYDAGLTLGGQNWDLAAWSSYFGPDIGFYVTTTSSASLMRVGDRVGVYPSVPYTFSMYNGGGTYTNDAQLQLNFYNSSDVFITQFIATGASPNSGYLRSTVTGTAPSNAAYVRVYFRAPTTVTGGSFYLAYKPKLEQGSSPTAWTDDATYGARFQTGQNIDALKPAELGANITETRTASAITNQGAWATSSLPTTRLTQIKPNVFPYPFGVNDGRSAAQIGWSNTDASGVGFSGLNMGRATWTDGGYYQFYRTTGTATTIFPFYDMIWGDGGGFIISAGITGYSTSGTFSPYLEFLNSTKSTVLSSANMTYNVASDRYEANGVTLPTNTYYIRVVCRGVFGSTSGTYQDITWWGIKVERGPNATPCLETPRQRWSGDQVEWSTGGELNALRPAEFGANITETRTAGAISGQGALATLSTIGASKLDVAGYGNIIPDSDYRDTTWWGIGSLPNVTLVDTSDANWWQRRAIRFVTDRDFDFTGSMFNVEVGATYRARVRIWNNNTTAGWTGAFWPMIHMPATAWWSLKHGAAVNPDTANSTNAIVANGDVAQDFYFYVSNNNMKQIQFRFKSTARGADVYVQVEITKVPQLGKDLMRPGTATNYITSEVETVLGTAAAVTNQGDLATANRSSLAFGQNAIVNSDFTRGTYAWTFGSGTSTSGINLPSWFGLRNVLYFTKSGVLSSGVTVDANQTGWWSGGNGSLQLQYGVPVKQGDRVYIRALLAQHRCTAQIYALVFDTSGNLLEAPSWTGGYPGGAGNGNPANFNVVGGLFTVTNSSAYTVQFMVRMLGTGESDPYVFMAEPAMGIVPSGQTVLPPYQPGRADPLGDQTGANQVTIIQPSDQIIYRDWQGTPKSGQLPRTLTPSVQRGSTDIRTSNDTTYSISNTGTISATINNTNGSADKGRITLSSGFGTINLSVSVSGNSYGPFPIRVTNTDDSPPVNQGSSGGSDSTLANVQSTSFAQITSVDSGESIFTVATTSSSQSIIGTAPLTYQFTSTSNGTRYLLARWEYRLQGNTTWIAFGSNITGSNSSWNAVDLDGIPGDINVNQTVVPGSVGTWEARLVAAWNTGTTGTIQIYDGTATISRG